MIKKKGIAMCIILSIITCGIYGLFWLAGLANDVKKISGDSSATSGGMLVLLSIITCNIYYLVWVFKAGDTLDRVRVTNGEASGNQGILYLLLSIFGLGIVSYALLQNEINRYAE